jgi:hypothetical protein
VGIIGENRVPRPENLLVLRFGLIEQHLRVFDAIIWTIKLELNLQHQFVVDSVTFTRSAQLKSRDSDP